MTKLLLICIMIPVFGMTQTHCDSLEVNCCDFSLIGNDTIILQAKNNNTQEIFDYPGFIILNESGDTIAKETVNYFGIGSGFQDHYLEILEPLILPFAGTLELHGLFYDTLYCQFPLSIDPLSVEKLDSKVELYPNPVENVLNVSGIHTGRFTVFTIDGKTVINNLEFENGLIDLSSLKRGLYLINLNTSRKPITKYILKQ